MTDRADVIARLRTAAAEHQPDRARMWARVVERAGAGPGREAPGGAAEFADLGGADRSGGGARARGRLRTAGAVAGLVGTLAVGGLVVERVTGGDGTPGAARTSPGAEAAVPGGSPAPSAGTADDTGGTAARRPREGYLRAEGLLGPGGNAHWAQSDVVLRTTRPLTSLTVELRIALTGRVRHTGSWCSRPVDDFDVTVREEGGALVYRWVLREGRTVPPGEYRFAGQYEHAEGHRDAGGDRYAATAAGPGGPASVGGGFRQDSGVSPE